MEFQVEREIDQHWYPVEGLIEAGSAGQAVARCALAEGTYRARATDTPDAEPEHFEVPAWGQPIPVRGR
jgi:hypothetical protein